MKRYSPEINDSPILKNTFFASQKELYSKSVRNLKGMDTPNLEKDQLRYSLY